MLRALALHGRLPAGALIPSVVMNGNESFPHVNAPLGIFIPSRHLAKCEYTALQLQQKISSEVNSHKAEGALLCTDGCKDFTEMYREFKGPMFKQFLAM